MLDEFAADKVGAPKVPSLNAVPPTSKALNKPAEQLITDDFSKQLQDQMAELMGNSDESPDMKREIEVMMRELGVAAESGALEDGSTPTKSKTNVQRPSSNAEEPFQESIRKTMERIQASGEQANAAAQSEPPDDMLAQMLKEMQSGDLNSAGNDEGFNKMLMGMMEQLTNKEILYEPMKELHDKFPTWMLRNSQTTGSDDMKRYKEQQRLVGEIVGEFERKGYSDSNSEDREFIVERMQQASSIPQCL